MFDSYNPDILFGEVLLRPQWIQTSATQTTDELRRNGGVPPPPQPKTPNEFVVQLYNPDQQVTVLVKPGSWGGSTTYEFAMPMTSFRTPSASALDKSLSDPATFTTTPKLQFTWRKDGILGKDYAVFFTGKSNDSASRRKGREPDIALGLFRAQKELTIYASNLTRVEIEDIKGLEIVLLLSAATIKDVYRAHSNIRDAFNIGDEAHQIIDPETPITNLPDMTTKPEHNRNSIPPPPLPDARAQWELDAETSRLQRQADKEALELRRREEADEAEARRLRRELQRQDAVDAKRRQLEVDRETERLRKEYGVPDGPVSGTTGNTSTSTNTTHHGSHGKKKSFWSMLSDDGNARLAHRPGPSR